MTQHFYTHIKYLIPIGLFVLATIFSCNQKKENPIQQDYQALYVFFANSEAVEDKLMYADILLKKAKKEKDTTMILAGYRMFSITHTDANVLAYSDSIITLKKGNSDNNYPAIAYEKKGDFYYNKRAYQYALDNYIQFAQYAKKHNQKEMIANANYSIGIVKRRTGNTKEALKLYQNNYAFTTQNKQAISDRVYLNSITALANVFNDMKVVDSATFYNKLGYKEAIQLKNERFQYHFALNQGISEYYDQKYIVAVDSISKHIPYFENLNDYDKLSFAYYYHGEAYLELGNQEKALENFKKVDTAFQKTNALFPIIRKAYIRLDEYYKKSSNFKQQLHYKNQLIKVDSILNADELYLNKTLFKHYEIPKLEAEKENALVEKKLLGKTFNKVVTISIVLMLILIIGFTIQHKKYKIARRKFQAVIQSKEQTGTTNKELENIGITSIPVEIIEDILTKLRVFEKENQFISNEITLNFLAKELNTNPNYLSKIVNHVKKISFSTYINNLRIDYAIEQLKTNPIYLKYTIKAIAAEVGFNNVQSFSKAFSNSTGINPSFFIRQLKKSIKQKKV